MYDIIGQDFYQRVLSAKNEKIAKIGCLFAGMILIAMGINSAVDGMLARALLGDLPDGVSAIAALAIHVLPTVYGGIVIAALVAAVMSTADSLLLACTSHIVNDIYIGVMRKGIDITTQTTDNKVLLKISVVTTFVVGIFSVVVALRMPNIISILLYSYTFYCSAIVAPVLLGLFWDKGDANAAISSILLGGITSILCAIGIIKFPIDPIIVGMIASFAIYLIVAFFPKKSQPIIKA